MVKEVFHVPGLSFIVSMIFLGLVAFVHAGKDQSSSDRLAKATFAGGCFWCMEPPFDKLYGVVSTTSGYIGGHKVNPTYEEVSSGTTGHAEAIQIVYDPRKITYDQLLEVFWKNVDPTDNGGQFCDRGSQYRTAIFYHDQDQKHLAEHSRQALIESEGFKEIATEITAASTFYPAEEYHQDYYKKNPVRYKFYRYSCGRDRRLKELWGGSH
ncbi:MAG: peptide-methionine (S)-S-oxide reductase MsrA [Thermodesulfobacteriota bacterium]|jgi:peptide-methionine (S)-S-oxide reductase